MIIQIDYDVSDEAVARVSQLLDDTALRDIDFNGAAFVIERGDGTCIVDYGGVGEYDASTLFAAINEEIHGDRQVPDGFRMTAKGEIFET